MRHTIFVVDDDNEIREALTFLFQEQGFGVKTADNGAGAITLLQKWTPDLVVLDLKLPKIDGEDVCRQIKKKHPSLPVVMLTAKGNPDDVVKGFDFGADDYIAKPFDSGVLLARVKARLKETSQNSVIQIADLSLNKETVEVMRGTKKIQLTPQEFQLLEYLMVNANKVVSRDMILNHIWSNSLDVETRVVDVYIGYLRKKIDGGQDKKLIQSVRGFGYSLKE